jgi:hypothetical protein
MLVHSGVVGQVQLIEASPVRPPGALLGSNVIDAAVSLPVLDHNHRNPECSRLTMKDIVRADLGNCTRRGTRRIQLQMTSVHINTHNRRTFWIKPGIERGGQNGTIPIVGVAVHLSIHRRALFRIPAIRL